MANFFVDKADIDGGLARIAGDEATHILRVLRMKEGDALTLCDGDGMFYDAVISSVGKNQVEADIKSVRPAPTEPNVKITLFQAIPKNPKLEFIIQKAAEIGVCRIVPVNTARIVAKLEKENKLQRLQKIAAEAAKQSRRGIIPEVCAPADFKDAVKMAAELDMALIPYEEESNLAAKDFLRGKKAGSVGVFIGPEGGFEESEVKFAKQNGVTPVSLGPRILRTETAGLVTAALVLYEAGEMN